MTPAQLEQINKTIESSVDKAIARSVNGKIDKLRNELNVYIKEDTEWKVKAEPVIKMGEQVSGFGKVSLYIVGFIASVGGAILVISNIIRNK